MKSEPIRLIPFDKVFPHTKGSKPLTRSQFIRLAKRVSRYMEKEANNTW